MSEYLQKLKSQVVIEAPVFIADNATVLGQVSLKPYVSVWFQAVIRADMGEVSIGTRTNIQDGAIIHTDPGIAVSIGAECIIGHGAILHGCTIGDNTLIGMRATVMNHAKIGKGCVIGANCLITEGMEIPDYSMVLGAPGKVVKTLPPEIVERLKLGAEAYVEEMKLILGIS